MKPQRWGSRTILKSVRLFVTRPFFEASFFETREYCVMKLPERFKYSSIACGVKASGADDLALVVCESECTAVGAYTQNLVHAASIDWNRSITPSSSVRAVVINSGNANACTGEEGVAANRAMAESVAKHLTNSDALAAGEDAGESLPVDASQVLVLSTGVIGHQLPVNPIRQGIAHGVKALAIGEAAFMSAANAILTTDKGPKTDCVEFAIDGVPVTIGGMCKGAGMIGPRMATMLCIITTDAKIESTVAHELLSRAVNRSFNRISVEGHMSTNDAVILIAGGTGASLDSEESRVLFSEQLDSLCLRMAKMIPDDGEGATHLIEVRVSGCSCDADADRIARAIGSSNLVKTAITGDDPNWGRIVSAAGYSCPADLDAGSFSLQINSHSVFHDGQPVPFDAVAVSQSIADNRETLIEMTVGRGPGCAAHWTSDLTSAYVHFNSEYHT